MLNGKIALSSSKNWMVGNFLDENLIFKTEKFEFGIHKHEKGEEGENHYHPHSTEINFIYSGSVQIKDKIFNKNEYFIFEPNEHSGCVRFLKNTTLFVFRDSSIQNDKVIVTESKKK